MRAGIDEQYQDDVSTALGNVNKMREACSLGAIRRHSSRSSTREAATEPETSGSDTRPCSYTSTGSCEI